MKRAELLKYGVIEVRSRIISNFLHTSQILKFSIQKVYQNIRRGSAK